MFEWENNRTPSLVFWRLLDSFFLQTDYGSTALLVRNCLWFTWRESYLIMLVVTKFALSSLSENKYYKVTFWASSGALCISETHGYHQFIHQETGNSINFTNQSLFKDVLHMLKKQLYKAFCGSRGSFAKCQYTQNWLGPKITSLKIKKK